MSWWLFLPLAYFATATDLVIGGDLAVGGFTPGALLLLWSCLTVRTDARKVLPQAWLCGLLLGFSGTATPGIVSSIAVLIPWLMFQIRKSSTEENPNWLLWSFPLMSLFLVTTLFADAAYRQIPVPTSRSLSLILTTVTGTFCLGIILACGRWLIIRLLPAKRDPHALNASSSMFFLSR